MTSTLTPRFAAIVAIVAIAVAVVPAAAGAAEPPAPGTRLDSANIGAYRDLLDDTLIELIERGDFSLTVGTHESFPVHPAYAEMSKVHAGQAALGAEPGELNNYVAGRPFGEPSMDDPRAGEKMAWNMRYGWFGDGGSIKPFFWQYRNMKNNKIEREIAFAAASMRFKHRVVTEPIPELPQNPSDIFNAFYLHVISPPDIRNTQVLIHRLEDDTRQEEGWLYIGSHRRVRRLPTGQNTDAFLGSDIMIEDFLGYNGRIMDMEWRFLGTREVLLPFFRHNEIPLGEREGGTDGFRFVAFGGRGGCYPQVTWQFRKAYVLEASPKWNQHPLSKRLYYVDAETYAPAYGRLYDRREKLWKFAIAAYSHPDHHLPVNQGSGVPILDAVTMIDLQAEHCTTLQPRSEIGAEKFKESDFVVQALRARGR